MLLAMHLPDHVLDVRVAVLTGVLAAVGLAICAWRLRRDAGPRMVLIPPVAAIVFAGQMVNYPLVGLEASGHLVGGTLAAIILGPWAAALTVALVLVVQCLVFGDGGLTALGTNVLNMALVSVLVGWWVYRALATRMAGSSGRVVAAMAASWVSVVAAALVCGLQLVAGSGVGAVDVLAGLAWYHAWIGLGEALLTSGAVVLLTAMAPGWLVEPAAMAKADTVPTARHAGAGLLAGLAIAALAAPWASGLDDGLERVLASLGLASDQAVWTWALFADYQLPLAPVAAIWSTALVGIVGTLLVFAGGQAVARMFARRGHVV